MRRSIMTNLRTDNIYLHFFIKNYLRGDFLKINLLLLLLLYSDMLMAKMTLNPNIFHLYGISIKSIVLFYVYIHMYQSGFNCIFLGNFYK